MHDRVPDRCRGASIYHGFDMRRRAATIAYCLS
jgi:hypothetical protein